MEKKVWLIALTAIVAGSTLACPPRSVMVTFENRSSHPTTEFFLFESGDPRGDNLLTTPVPGGEERVLGSFAAGTYEAAATVDIPNKGLREITWDPFVMEAGEDWTLYFMDEDIPAK